MLGVSFIIMACFLWAFDALVRYPLVGSGVSPIKVVLLEHAFLTIIFLPFLFKIRKKVWDARLAHLFYFFIVGGIGSAIATLAFTKAFTLLNPSLVIIFQKFQPVVAIFLARLFLKESLDKQFIVWAMVCLTGGFLISFTDLFEQIPKAFSHGDLLSDRAMNGYLMVLISVVGWGATTVFGKKLAVSGYNHKEIMCGRFILGFMVLLPILFYNQETVVTEPINYLKVVIMVLVSGLAGMYFYYQGLLRVSARTSALTEMFFPFAAVVINWIFLDTVLATSQIVGGAMLLIGASVIQYKHL